MNSRIWWREGKGRCSRAEHMLCFQKIPTFRSPGVLGGGREKILSNNFSVTIDNTELDSPRGFPENGTSNLKQPCRVEDSYSKTFEKKRPRQWELQKR